MSMRETLRGEYPWYPAFEDQLSWEMNRGRSQEPAEHIYHARWLWGQSTMAPAADDPRVTTGFAYDYHTNPNWWSLSGASCVCSSYMSAPSQVYTWAFSSSHPWEGQFYPVPSVWSTAASVRSQYPASLATSSFSYLSGHYSLVPPTLAMETSTHSHWVEDNIPARSASNTAVRNRYRWAPYPTRFRAPHSEYISMIRPPPTPPSPELYPLPHSPTDDLEPQNPNPRYSWRLPSKARRRLF